MKEKRKHRRYSREFKLAAVERMRAGESPSAMERELGVSRKLLYDWKRRVAETGAGELRENGGRRRKTGPEGEADKSAEERIAALERLVGKQQALLDFFENALRRIEAGTAGKAGFTKRSGVSGTSRERS